MLKRLAGFVVSTLWITLASTCRTGASSESGIVTDDPARLLEQIRDVTQWSQLVSMIVFSLPVEGMLKLNAILGNLLYTDSAAGQDNGPCLTFESEWRLLS